MNEAYKVAVLVGSLRQESINRKLANALVDRAPATMQPAFVQIGDLPLYNPDLDTDDRPHPWQRFRDDIGAASAILFVTPEYNRSIPASIKNALDVGSRPMGESVWNGKPAAVVTGSPGGIGGFGANHILRQSLVFLNVPAMQQPEAYIGGIGDLFEDSAKVTKPQTSEFLEKFMQAFAKWISRHVDQ